MDFYSNFLLKNTTIELLSHGNQGNIVCTKFKFVGTFTMFPCIPYYPYLFSWNICVNAKRGAIKRSSILFKIGTYLKFN
jgi:hypothetical protein